MMKDPKKWKEMKTNLSSVNRLDTCYLVKEDERPAWTLDSTEDVEKEKRMWMGKK